MAITYPLTFPTTFGVSRFTIDLVPIVAVSKSAYTAEQQIQEHQGITWQIQFQLDLLDRDQAEEYNAFLYKLKGRVGTFNMAIPGSETARGVATGTPVVKGANQTGDELIIGGMTVSTTNIFKAGDFIQLSSGLTSRLHKVLDNANSDISGDVTVNLAPKIITAPADTSAVVVSSAAGIFRLTSNSNPVTIQSPNVFSLNMSAEEVF